MEANGRLGGRIKNFGLLNSAKRLQGDVGHRIVEGMSDDVLLRVEKFQVRMNISEELLRAIDALNPHAVPYALCGGLAVVIHGYVRLTDDIDLLMPQAEIPRAKEALKQAGFGFVNPEVLHFQNTMFPVTIHRVVRFAGEEHVIVDLIEVNESLQDIWNGREPFKWEGRKIHVVSRAGLLQMKKNAGRAQDMADIENLQNEGGAVPDA